MKDHKERYEAERDLAERRVRHRTKMGFKRDPNEPRVGLKRSGFLRRTANVSNGLKLIYASVKGYALRRLIELYGRMDGTERVELAPCACCGSFIRVPNNRKPDEFNVLDPDHIKGRKGSGPGELLRLVDPANIQYICRACHNTKTNPLTGPDHTDYAAKNLPMWRAEMIELQRQVISNLPPHIPGSQMQWSRGQQVEAFNEVFKVMPDFRDKN